MELGYCYACGNRNAPEDKKCKKCGAEIINLDRSSTVTQGLRSGAIAGFIVGIVGALIIGILGTVFTGSALAGGIVFVIVIISWTIQGLIVGAVAGATNSLCFYKNASGIGAIVGFISFFILGGDIYLNVILGAFLGSLASYIERKHFRKMKWLE